MTAERSEFANSGNTGNISIAIDGPRAREEHNCKKSQKDFQ